ncbi:MAG: hypothetical protein ACLQVI_25715 [Polyangiaceae bacterium]
MNKNVDEIKRIIASDVELAEDVFDWHASILFELSDSISENLANPAPASAVGVDADADVQEEPPAPWDGSLTPNELQLIEATRRLHCDVWGAIQRTGTEARPLLEQIKMAIVGIHGATSNLREDPDGEDLSGETSECGL